MIATAPKLDRTTLQTSRLLDFCSEKELTAQVGHDRTEWPLVIIKELVDNAIDACEEASTAPVIKIRVDSTGITVTDNGSGLPESTIEGLLDYSKRTSSREAYVSPTRGAQGNALQTVLAVPYVVDGTAGRTDICSEGKRHRIVFTVDRIRQTPIILRDTDEAHVKIGTSVKVWWPFVSMGTVTRAEAQFLQMAAAYTLLNPHLSLWLDWFGEGEWVEATDMRWAKWGPSDPTRPHWYEQEHLERLLGAYISHDEACGADRPIREVVAEFRGLAGSAKQRAVLDAAGLLRKPLSALVNCNGLQHDLVAKLLGAMREHSKPVKPATLGVIGREHVGSRFADLGADLDTFQYRRVADTDASGVPYVLECAFAASEDEGNNRRFVAGINWSPSLVNPFLKLSDEYGSSLDSLLADQYCGRTEPVILLVHLARPRPQFRDRGKATVTIEPDLGSTICDAVTRVTAGWRKVRRAEEREAERRWRRRELLTRKRDDRTTIKDAVFAAMPQAVQDASGKGRYEFPERNLYYSVREILQKSGDSTATLQWKTFCQIVNQYERERGPIPGKYNDPRGFLIEPHTGRVIPLGTREVDRYTFPPYLYKKIMYVEKKGELPIFQGAKLAERYDMAIVCAEGYACGAAKTLLAAAQEQLDMTILSLHDADPYGYNIARTLREATASCPNHHIDVIDIGLGLEEALAMGLDTEEFVRKKALPSRLELTETELEYFIGEETLVDGRRAWKAQRIELNSLAKNPDIFIGWVEDKLRQHGLDKKLVPPAKAITALARVQSDEILGDRVWQEVCGILGVDQIVEQVIAKARRRLNVADIPRHIKEWATKLEPTHWRECVKTIIKDRVDAIEGEMRVLAETVVEKEIG